MGLINRHGPAVKAVPIELPAGFISVRGGHFDKGKTISNHIYRKNSSDDAEQSLDGGRLRAVRKVPDQEFLCRCSWHLHTYADVRIIMHCSCAVKNYFQVAAVPLDMALGFD
jgi:hypothetical protein